MSNSTNETDDFDNFAIKYREIHDTNIRLSGTNSEYFSKYKADIVSLSESKDKNKGINILDLGCGDGNSLKYFREYFPNATLNGVDISTKSIEVAKLKGLHNTVLSAYDGKNIPYDSDVFDIVFLAGVIHHVPVNERDMLLAEVYRVLKKNGRLFIFEHNPFNPLTRKLVNDCVFDINANLITANDLKKKLSLVGLKKNAIKYTIFFPRHKAFKLFWSLEKKLEWLPAGGQYYIKSIKN